MEAGNSDIEPATPDVARTFALLMQAGAGDREALEAYLLRIRPRMEAWITLRLGPLLRSRLDVEDVVQETLLQVFLSVERFEPVNEKAAFGWVCRIAENRIRDLAESLRAQKRDPERERELHSQLAASWASPSLIAVRREEHELLLISFRDLSRQQREILRLVKIEGKSYAEAGEALGVTAKAAGVRLVRATRAWRERRASLAVDTGWGKDLA